MIEEPSLPLMCPAKQILRGLWSILFATAQSKQPRKLTFGIQSYKPPVCLGPNFMKHFQAFTRFLSFHLCSSSNDEWDNEETTVPKGG